MMKEYLENVRNTVPLVHNITNYVTVNDVANMLLACGGSPIMSDEAEDISISELCIRQASRECSARDERRTSLGIPSFSIRSGRVRAHFAQILLWS